MKYFVICGFVFFISFFGLLTAQQLMLPDETIVGYVEISSDSLDLKVDISEYHRLGNQDKLAYRPSINKKSFFVDNKHFDGYFQAIGNTASFLDFKLGVESHRSPELNLFAGFHIADYGKKELDTTKGYVSWQPMVNYTSLRLRPAASFKYNKDQLEHQASGQKVESELASICAAIDAEPHGIKHLKRLNLMGEYHTSQLDKGTFEDTFEDDFFDFDSYVSFADIGFVSEIEGGTYSRFDKLQGEANAFFAVPFFDRFGANVTMSEKFYPSAYITKNIKTSDYTEISLANQPYLDKQSVRNYYEFYPFSSLKDLKYAPQAPLNLFAAFSLFSPVEARISYNMQYIENYVSLFAIKGTVMDVTLPPSYEWRNDNVRKNIFVVETSKKIEDIKLSLMAEYMVSEYVSGDDMPDHIPWEPHFVASISAEYIWQYLTIFLGGEFLGERYEHNGKRDRDPIEISLPNAFRVTAFTQYDLNRHFKVFASVKHLFSEKDGYRRVENLHKEEFSAEAGVRVLF
ncbi:MAG: hypothetical protein FWG20_03035 [Candidatus Cloacimonetes bacterium]|nr:hypothetical protein [Candidatus Cloacimonadota bacterium]